MCVRVCGGGWSAGESGGGGRDMFITEQKHMLSMISPCLSISYLRIKAHLYSLETNSISVLQGLGGRREATGEGGPQGGHRGGGAAGGPAGPHQSGRCHRV